MTPTITTTIRPFIRGSVRVKLLYPDGTLDREIDLGKNVIALDWTLLIASMIKDPNTPGITHLAVGTGDPSYDILDPPVLTAQKKLVAELTRKRIRYTNFVDDVGDPTLEESGLVDLVTAFDLMEAVGTLQEFGLFGGVGATERNGGKIVNYKGFNPFVKPNDRAMVIVWRLRFEF